MSLDRKRNSDRKITYNMFRTKGTGGFILKKNKKIKTVPFGNFDISIKLTSDNQFKGIYEVRVKKDFRSPDKRIVKGFHDVEEFYEK